MALKKATQMSISAVIEGKSNAEKRQPTSLLYTVSFFEKPLQQLKVSCT